MKSFITGVTGFAGSYLAEHLLAAGDEVWGCSRSARWGFAVPEQVRREVRVLPWNIDELRHDKSLYDALVEFAPEAIYHLAALAVPDDCGRGWPTRRAGLVNVGGTARMLDVAASLPSQPRFLFVSSSHVYAPATREQYLVDEQAPLDPRAGYGASKLAGETLVARARRERGLSVVIARAFQHTGPRHDAALMLPAWAQQFASAEDKPVRVYNRDSWIDLSDVRDVVRAYRLLVERGDNGGIYNVGSGHRQRSGDVLAVLQQLAGSPREVLELHPGEKQNWIADRRRLTACTGWEPEIPLTQTVADTLAYWRHRAACP